MGRRGPQKKLAAIERLECNPGCYPIEESGVAGLGEPFIPEHLPDDARGCIGVIKVSMPPGVYSALDSFLLWRLRWFGQFTKRPPMRSAGLSFNGRPQASAAVRRLVPGSELRTSRAQMLASLGDRLGLDPKSRAALKLPNARQQRSKFEGLIGAPVYRPLGN